MTPDVHTRVAAYLADALSRAYAESGRAPQRTSVGGSPTTLPSEVVVRELPESVEVTDPVTSRPTLGGRPYQSPLTVTCSCGVEIWSVRARLTDAAADAWAWWQVMASVVAADRTLGGLVAHAVPYYSGCGTSPRDNQFAAGVDCGVRYTTEITSNTQEATNGN